MLLLQLQRKCFRQPVDEDTETMGYVSLLKIRMAGLS